MRPAAVTWMLILLGACLRTPGYQCATADQCALDGVAGRCEANSYCSLADGACASGFKWAPSAPQAGACVEGAGPDARPDDAGIDGAPRLVNECLVQPKLRASDSACTTSVCAADARCCAREWSDQCVQLTEQRCGKSCSQRLATVGDGLVRVQAWSGSAFTTIWSHPVHATIGYGGVAWGDVDGDRLPDLVSCTEGGDAEIWLNGGTCGEAFCPGGAVHVTDCADVEWVDADADGDLDVMVIGAYWSGLWINDAGLFGATVDLLDGNYHTGMDWADLDGDGYLDLALAQYNTASQVARVTRPVDAVVITDSGWVEPGGDGRAHTRAIFGDLDGDGVLDLVSTGPQFTQVWRNTSTTGGFASDATPYFTTTTYGGLGAALGDMDEDGDLDIVGATEGAPLTLTRNRRDSGMSDLTVTPLWQSADSFGEARVVVGDVDGDGHLDIVVGPTPATPATATSVFLARPGTPWKFGTAANQANAVDPDARIVRDLALGPAW